MALMDTPLKYGSVSKFFHWVIFLFIAFMLILGYTMIYFVSDKVAKGQLIYVHKVVGLLVLCLIVLRLIWRAFNVKPMLHNVPTWQRWAERAVHYLLYTCVLAMPLSGWIGSVAAEKPPRLGSLVFNLPISPNESLVDFAFGYIHVPIAIVLVVLVGMHVSAAMYHHFVKKDNILLRMLPDGE